MGIDVGRMANEDRRRAEYERNMREQTEALKRQAEAAKRQADAAQWQSFQNNSSSQSYTPRSSSGGKIVDAAAIKIFPLVALVAVIAFLMQYWKYIVCVAIAGVCLFAMMKIAKKATNPGPKILTTGLVGIALIIIILVAAPAPNKTQPARSQTPSTSSAQTPSTQTTPTRYMLVNAPDFLNVRSGPSVEHGVVGKLDNNTRVQVLNSSGLWWKIKSGNIEGYVNSSYLIEEKAPSTRSTSSLPQNNLQTEPMHGEPRRLISNVVKRGWTGDQKFQDDYERAVRGYDRRMQGLPPGLVLPGGKTVQETIDSAPTADK